MKHYSTALIEEKKRTLVSVIAFCALVIDDSWLKLVTVSSELFELLMIKLKAYGFDKNYINLVHESTEKRVKINYLYSPWGEMFVQTLISGFSPFFYG